MNHSDLILLKNPQSQSRLAPITAASRFCSLAELKTCLDTAQVKSQQKESKNSILKLLEDGNPSNEKELYRNGSWNTQNSRVDDWQDNNADDVNFNLTLESILPGLQIPGGWGIHPPII